MRGKTLLLGGLAVVATCGVGCHRPSNPWKYAAPPAVAVDDVYARPLETGRTVIAIAEFANPDAPQLDWPDVGLEMTRAMRRALFNESDFEIRIAPEIEQLVSQPGFLKGAGDPDRESVEVDYVLTGKVTDFHHTAGLHKDVSRWGLFSRRNEAVVAFEWKVVDVRRHRVVAADHTYGTAEASRKKSVDEIYAGLDASAYLFWNTPLGRAGHVTVDKTIRRMRELLPMSMGTPWIAGRKGGRRVNVHGGSTWGLEPGQEYYLALAHGPALQPKPVIDPDTGRPLMVRIDRVKKDSSTAWLLGQPSAGLELKGAILSQTQPSALPADVADRETLGSVRDKGGHTDG